MLAAEEAVRPYERPPLSKRYLQGQADRDSTFVHPLDWYDANQVELLPGTAVTRIDRSPREVTLSGGGHLAYDKLLLATGPVPRRLPLPGADANGVLYLRKVGDSDQVVLVGVEVGRPPRRLRGSPGGCRSPMTTGTDMPPALPASDARFRAGAAAAGRQHPMQLRASSSSVSPLPAT